MRRSSRLSRPSVAADAIAGSGKQVEVPDVKQQRDEEDGAAEHRVHGVLVAAKVEQHRVCVFVPRSSMVVSLFSRRLANLLDCLRESKRSGRAKRRIVVVQREVPKKRPRSNSRSRCAATALVGGGS